MIFSQVIWRPRLGSLDGTNWDNNPHQQKDGQSQRRCDHQFILCSLPKEELGFPFSTGHTI